MDVDPAGNVIFANTDTHSIWLIPIGPLDQHGNPTYDWKDAKEVIPGGIGGCFVGEGKDAKLSHYSPDGLLIGIMQPGDAMSKETGWLDNHASVAVNRDPRDGMIDVFAEDDYVLRIGWYRVNDKDVEMQAGKVEVER